MCYTMFKCIPCSCEQGGEGCQMKKYEYCTKLIDAKGVFGGKVSVDEFDRTLNDLGRDGWELVSITDSNQSYGSTRWIICVFKRELL